MIDRLVGAFLIIALCGVILMGSISYFLVNWINRPLEQMLNAAKRAAEGDLTHEVPVVARDEIGQLAATFNLMIRNLAESRKKLEEWGTQLASKVAEQTGQLDQAREQVERVKKLRVAGEDGRRYGPYNGSHIGPVGSDSGRGRLVTS